MGRRRPRGRLERAVRAVRRAVAAARQWAPVRDLAPLRPGLSGHAAGSFVGIPAGGSQGWRGRRRSGLLARTAARCAPSARSALLAARSSARWCGCPTRRSGSAFPPVCFGLLSPAPHVSSQQDPGGVDQGWSRSLYPLSHLPPLTLPQRERRAEN